MFSKNEYFKCILLLVFFFSSYCCDSFYYFAYGSNLLESRLHINSPSAEVYAIGTLESHRLDFNMYNQLWNGSVATIVEDSDEKVMGVLWTIDVEDIPHLDEQEGVSNGEYFAKNVTVITTGGQAIRARTYVEVENPSKIVPYNDLPLERRPSNTYLEVLIIGAVESGLPSDYIGYLVSFPTNGCNAGDSIRNRLGYPFGPK